jgi:heme A synthase
MTVDQLNAVFGPLIYLLLIVLTAAMGVRVVRHLLSGRRTPLLLARDFLLFLYLLLTISVAQYTRANGITGLSQDVAWVALTNVLATALLGLWVAIEMGIVRQRPTSTRCPHCGGAL